MSSSSSEDGGIPRSSDGAPNWAADTDPVDSGAPGPVFVEPGPSQDQLQEEVGMSTAEFGDTNLGQAPAPVPAPDGLLSPLSLSPVAPLDAVAPPAEQPALQPLATAPLDLPAVPVQDMRDVPLGTLIFREGLLTEEQLEEALQDGMQRGKRLGEVLLERGLVSEHDLGRLLAGQKGLRFVELDSAVIDPAAVQLLPVEKARLHSVLPFAFQDGLPVVAVADPSNDLVVENVRRSLNCEPHLVVAGREALHRQIEVAYGTAPQAVVAAQEPLVAPVVPATPVAPAAPVAAAPEVLAAPVEPVPLVVQPEPVQAQPVQALTPEPPSEGVWLQAPEPQPLTPPAPAEPVAEAPVVAQVVVPEPVAISYAPVEPLAQPTVEAQAPLPVVGPVVVAEPVPAPEPVVAPEPVATPAPVVAVEPVVAVQPVVAVEPAVAPTVAPTVAPPEPVLEAPAPPLQAPAPNPDEDAVMTWSVVLRLVDGDRAEIGAFHSAAEAKEHAQYVVRQISTEHGWPFFDGRYIRPEAIISVDLAEPEGRWLGSAARRQAWDNKAPS